MDTVWILGPSVRPVAFGTPPFHTSKAERLSTPLTSPGEESVAIRERLPPVEQTSGGR